MTNNTTLRWGYIDTSGNIVIKPSFGHAWQFTEDLAIVKIGPKYGYIDRTGDVRISAQYLSESQPFFEGLAAVEIEEHCFGFIDVRGEVVIPPQFEWAESFNEKLALVGKEGLMGYIHRNGDYAINPVFSHASDFSEGLASVSLKREFFFIDSHGNTVFGPFRNARPFSSGFARVSVGAGKNALYILSRKGDLVPIPTFDWVGSYCRYNRIQISVNQKHGFIDTNANVVIEPQFDDAKLFTEERAAVKIEDKWGFIDPLGSIVIPPQFDKVSSFSEGLAGVTSNGKHAFIRRDGSIAFETPFFAPFPFCNGLTPVYEKVTKK